MKYLPGFLMFTAAVFAGCVYEVPMTTDNNVAIDPALPGMWAPIPDNGEKPDSGERILVLEYSETEYMVQHPVGAERLYYRAYPIRIGDINCVQLQVIGTSAGPVRKSEKNMFLVVSYQLKDDVLEISMLNPDVVGKEVRTKEELVKEFLKHKENKDLFSKLGKFRKIKPDM